MIQVRVVSSVLLIILALLIPTNVSAGIIWCRADPVVSLNGTLVDVWVEIPLEYVPLVNGPVTYTIYTPPSIDHQLIVNDLGYNGHGSVVDFLDRDDLRLEANQFETTVVVHVPIDRSRLAPGEKVPAQLSILETVGDEVLELGTATGTTESVKMTVWITDY